jgi:PncC family amidohydrolase
MDTFDKKDIGKAGQETIEKKADRRGGRKCYVGLLQFAFSCIPDAACFFQGGITAYNIAQKFKHLQVEPLHALSVNCVSVKVAKEMALHVCQLYSSDWGIGITGYASPVPESGNKVFAFFAITYRGTIKSSGKINPRKKDPPELQWVYTDKLLRKMLSLL